MRAPIVGKEPFALLLPDMLIHAKPGCLSQMMDVYEDRAATWSRSKKCPGIRSSLRRRGRQGRQDNAFPITGMVEKPKRREAAPSNLIISGRYILQPEIFAGIEKQEPGAGGEIQITDAMIRLMASSPSTGLNIAAPLMTAATRWASSPPMWRWRWNGDDVGPGFRAALRKILAQIRAGCSAASSRTGEGDLAFAPGGRLG